MAEPVQLPRHLVTAAADRPFVARGDGIYLHTADGDSYIDGCSGSLVVNVGHSNPRVLKAMTTQMESLTFSYRSQFRNETTERYAYALAAALPARLDRIFFVSGGSEAVEACLKVARHHAVAKGEPDRRTIISLAPSYHGATLGALAVTGHDQRVAGYEPMLSQHLKIPAPSPFEIDAPTDETDQDRGLRLASALEKAIVTAGAESVLAFIIEPIGGATTGAMVAPDSFYPEVRHICDAYGVLLIFDEVMSGAGRSGRYLAAEHWGVTPDIVALSKGLGSGYVPLGAMVTTDAVLSPLEDGEFIHGHTYAGNPLACAAGQAVLAEVVDGGLLANATARGDQLMAGLEALKARHRIIGDVRGKGLLTGIEFVANRDSGAIFPPEQNVAAAFTERCFERKLLVYPGRSRGGLSGDHVLVGPPLIIAAEEIDEILSRLDDALVALRTQLGL